jgi:hypothetical protein
MLINCIKGIDNGKFKLNTTKAKKARTDLSIELSKLLVNNRKIFTGKSGEALRNAMVEIAMPFDAIDYKNLKSDLIHLNSVLDNKGEVSLWKMIKEFLFRAKKHFAAK